MTKEQIISLIKEHENNPNASHVKLLSAKNMLPRNTAMYKVGTKVYLHHKGSDTLLQLIDK